MDITKQRNGIFYTISAYIIWGFLPIYWKLVDHVIPGEILAQRIVWAFGLMLLIVLLSKNMPAFIKECMLLLKNKWKLLAIAAASITISINWLIFIWAVNSGYIIQVSLGYYINPLISIFLGIVILKEKLTRRQKLSFIIASLGVLNLTFSFGVFPWISLALAISFALYGLLKKTIDIGTMFGLTVETMIVAPAAIIYLIVLPETAFTTSPILSKTPLLIIGSGIVTAVPLLLFAHGAKRIPLAMVGFLQYIAPTIMLIIGVFLFKETFSFAHFISFSLIWIALIIYMLPKISFK